MSAASEEVKEVKRAFISHFYFLFVHYLFVYLFIFGSELLEARKGACVRAALCQARRALRVRVHPVDTRAKVANYLSRVEHPSFFFVAVRVGFEYSRSGNPTRNCLEKAVAALDGAKYCLALASGLAATMTVTHLLKAGDGIVCMNDVYGGTNRYFSSVASEFGLEVSLVDCTQHSVLKAALKPNTKLLWIETPTNPTMKVVDIEACSKIAHEYNKDIIVVVDNTFMSAYFQRPLALGADICMYSATKYMNGHSDVVMGLLSLNEDHLYERLKFLQNAVGAVPSPFDCYLCNRGLKTLPLRMKQHFSNAIAVAQFLEADPRVEKVIFPGLPSHPQHELMKKQCTGCPGMVTFYIKGNLEHATIFLHHLKMFVLAESLGGYESLAEHPAIMTHASVPENERVLLGISDTLIRLSVGLEDEKDIIEDLDQALSKTHPRVK